ncbi:MAG: isoprenylcysteine carboxylmethyltransferase family protein [Bdellovibrionales bacterium]
MQSSITSERTVTRPVTATSPFVAACGVGAFLAAIIALKVFHPPYHIAYLALFVMAVTALGVFIPDVLINKIHLRMRGSNLAHHRPSWGRTFTKFAGLLGGLGFIGLGYGLFPEYQGSFYVSYYKMLKVVLPPMIVLALPYIYWVDARMAEPRDGMWHMGCLVTFRWREMEWPRVVQYLLGWLVKGYFLPLMFTYVCNDLRKFIYTDMTRLQGFKMYFDFLFDTFYFIDVAICACGYLFAMVLMDTQIRSTEPTLVGWGVALLCYEPFWSLIGRQYIAYDPGKGWGDFFQYNYGLYVLWGCLILVLTIIYVWATVAFGMRFSNLTHRGIITSGPYRWVKHPAYLSKNLSWWLISMPFIAHNGNASECLRHSALLLMLNFVYYMRAKTEERHLSRDPVYVQYSAWIKENGLFGKIKHWGMKHGFNLPPLRTHLR